MSKPIRFVAAGDNHGDLADPEALDALAEFCRDYKPDVRVMLGDCFDMRSLRGKADDAEHAESLKDDINAGIAFLRAFRPTVYLMGNHEHRLNVAIASTGSAIKRDYCQDILDGITSEAKLAGCKTILPYHAERGVYRLGPVAFVHGYAHGVNAVHDQGKHYADRGGALVCGHIHRLEQVNLQKHQGGAAFSAGCLCRKEDMAYASHRLASSRWGLGFAAGWVDGDQWKVWLVHRISPGRWIWQTDLKIYSPKL